MPFGNCLQIFDISGQELAKQLENGLKSPNMGDQMTGLTFTYTAIGDENTPREEREYTILSVTLDDGTEVDISDTEKLYRVCTAEYNATVPGSVFERKEPLVSGSDAPIDNETMIRLLRENREAGGGFIPVDTSPRGIEIPAAGGQQ